ncbi:hypothetical protein IMCC3317_02310 [Kordia antarctica]|uniref:Uncharacterized protein n=1 Tax=Kordia antarctica TaxID=1218801 RepID=A0A7L4ZFA9_9FLAO|nr:hypothetical protein [Kordia antarctica]QHI34886.1 hypothetical protein IMCC3317_02310 [Kordia antarctica]
MEDKIFDLLMYTVPAIITGGIAYFFFRDHMLNEDKRRRYLLHKDAQKEALPIRLQAYERLSLFLERITPTKLLIRVTPASSDVNEYERLLIMSIEQEFDHNLSQQIYMSDQCWNIIIASKNTTIQLVRKASLSEKVTSADKLREVILTEMMEQESPSSTALAFIKKEVGDFLNT